VQCDGLFVGALARGRNSCKAKWLVVGTLTRGRSSCNTIGCCMQSLVPLQGSTF
jgi:hypothetical protein